MANFLSRRTFMHASAFFALGSVAESLLLGDGMTVVVSVPAAQMRSRAVAFRSSFVANYLSSNTPLPVYSLLARSGLLPDSLDAERLLGGCGNLIASNGAFRLSTPPQQSIVMPYHALVADQALRIQVTIPKDLSIRVQDDANAGRMQVTLQPPIQVTQIDRLIVNGIVAPIPVAMLLTQITLDGTQLRYSISDTNSSARYAIALDFTQNSGSPTIRFEAPTSSTGVGFRATLTGTIVLSLCFFAAGCVNNVHSGGPGQPVVPPPYPDKEVCFNQPAPTGFIRIDSKAAGLQGCPSATPTDLNVFVYTDYVNRGSGTQLLVCADAGIPAGWTDVSGAYHDEKGCDASKYQGTPFGNVRLIYKN